MTVLAAEAAEGAGEGAFAGASRAGRRGARRGERLRARRVERRTPLEGEMGGTQTETETYERRGPRGNKYAQQYGQQAAYVASNARLTGRSAHQGAILAEFLTAMVIIIVAPIATGGSGVGVSPYAARDLKRIGAIGAVYFALALVPGDNGSKVAAWLGGLVLLIIAMRAVSSGELKSIVDIFSPGGTEPPGATTGSSSPGTAPPPGAGAVPPAAA